MNTFIKESVKSLYGLGGYDNRKEGISKESITACHSIIYHISIIYYNLPLLMLRHPT